MKNLLEMKENKAMILEEKMMDLGLAVSEAVEELDSNKHLINNIFYNVAQAVDYEEEYKERMEEVDFYRELLKNNGYRVSERVIKELQEEVKEYYQEHNLSLYLKEQSKRDENELRSMMISEIERFAKIFKEWEREEEFYFRGYGRSISKLISSYLAEAKEEDVFYGKVVDEMFLEELLYELSILNQDLAKKYNNEIPMELINKLYNSILELEEAYFIYSLRA